MQFEVSVKGEGPAFVTKKVPVQVAMQVVMLISVLEEQPAKEVEAPQLVENRPRKKYKKRKAKVVEQFSVAPGKKKPRGNKLSNDQIEEVLTLQAAGLTTHKIVEKLGFSQSTVYRIVSGLIKPTKKVPQVSTTPEKEGEREIDKKPPMLTAAEYTDVLEAHGDGMATDAIAFSMRLDTEEVRRAMKCDNYTEYTAKY